MRGSDLESICRSVTLKMKVTEITFAEGRERCRVPMAAPACGLCLESVYYQDYFPPPESWPENSMKMSDRVTHSAGSIQ